jgi:hypothetical protein
LIVVSPEQDQPHAALLEPANQPREFLCCLEARPGRLDEVTRNDEPLDGPARQERIELGYRLRQ